MTTLVTAARGALRELRSRDFLLLLLGAAFIGFTFALLEHRALAAFALDRALVGSTFGLLVPLCCFVVTLRLMPARPKLAQLSAAPAGGNSKTAFLGKILVLFGVQAAIATGLALLTLAATGSAHWTRELAALLWIAPLSAVAHGAAQLLGTIFNRRGAALVLICDWIFGSTHGALALPWPRAHVRNLLGGVPPLDLSQAGSALILTVLVIVGALLWIPLYHVQAGR